MSIFLEGAYKVRVRLRFWIVFFAPFFLLAQSSSDLKEKAKPRYKESRLNFDYEPMVRKTPWLMREDIGAWPFVFDATSHTKPSIVVKTDYSDVKEDDPSLKRPVVKDYCFLNTVHIFVPIASRFCLDFTQIYYHQRENDLYSPDIAALPNYSAYREGGQITSHYSFSKNWGWDAFLRGFYMWGKQKGVWFPFENTARFESGMNIFYNDGRKFFIIDGHRESYIIKDFSQALSTLLATDCLTGGLGIKIGEEDLLELEAWMRHIFIADLTHNRKNSEEGVARLFFPWKRYFSLLYRFEHSRYDKLNINYYSYKRQFRNTIGACFHLDVSTSCFWNVTYEYRWQTTRDLFQPIGDFILARDKQYLIANRISSRFCVQHRDKFLIDLEGHYFYETLPSRDWNLKATLTMRF